MTEIDTSTDKLIMNEDLISDEYVIRITQTDRNHYTGPFSGNCKFKTPEEEFEHNKTKFKKCNKCSKNLSFNCFGNNTASKDPFDKQGYRLKRGDCIECNKKLAKGKQLAVKIAKKNGINSKAPEGTCCEICGKTDNIVFDHHHSKEEFRGWLCNGCNRSIGMLGEDIKAAIDVVNYLNKNENLILAFDTESKKIIIVNNT
jgi:hypothetical protein